MVDVAETEFAVPSETFTSFPVDELSQLRKNTRWSSAQEDTLTLTSITISSTTHILHAPSGTLGTVRLHLACVLIAYCIFV